MDPIYKFQLYAGTVTQRAFPIYKDDLAKDFEKESNQEFFRAKLSGKLTFQSDDYTFIVSQAFDTQFVLEIFISYNAGQSWTSYWRGTFWKTDCEFDNDTQTVIVQPTVWDQYNDVLAGMDKEYNLIELAPEIVPVKADKRPMIQVYVPGQSVIGCFLSGMWWEQEAEPESDETKLVNDFKFALNKVMTIADVSGSMSPQLPAFFNKTFPGDGRFNPATQGTTDFVGTEYTMRYYFYAGGGGATQRWQILRNSDSTVLWEKVWSGGTVPDTSLPQTVVLTPVSGTGATGNVTLYVHDMPVYSRYVLDTTTISGLDTYPIPADDIVENNRNYTRVIGYYFPDTIYFSTSLTSTPNQWGLYEPGQYYQPPYLYWNPELFPIARNAWGRVSIWFTFSTFDWIVEESGRQPFTIRHAYPIASVISVLLNKIGAFADGIITEYENTKYWNYINGTKWSTANTVYCEIIPMRTGITYELTFANSVGGYCVILDSQPTTGQNVNFATGYTTQINTTQGQVVTIQGTTGQFLYVRSDSVPNGRVFPVIRITGNGITHEATTEYSEFLYGTNLLGINQTLLITPKSNIVSAGYDQPAQKAPITLKNVLDMLRDCFRCYWFIDEQNRFRIEHIQYFRNGGSYSGSPVVGIDLTAQQVPRNGKPWAFARDQFKFDKPAMAARYQFGWMDDVTQLFDGFPIDIISKYVNPDNIEQIDISRFTSDIDYILLNPGAVSKDGFALLGANYVFEDLPHTINGWLNRNTGGANSSSSYERTDYIPVAPGGTIKYSGSVTGSAGGVMGYDADKHFVISLSGWGSYTNREITIPDGVYFIRACGLISGQTVDFSVSYCPGLSLQYYNFVIENNDHYLQNAYVAFCILQNYYAFDMPAPLYSINGVQMYAQGIKKLKNQSIRFPVLNDPDLLQLVKTNLGNGTIEKLSVNLSSRNANATLKYDTE